MAPHPDLSHRLPPHLPSSISNNNCQLQAAFATTLPQCLHRLLGAVVDKAPSRPGRQDRVAFGDRALRCQWRKSSRTWIRRSDAQIFIQSQYILRCLQLFHFQLQYILIFFWHLQSHVARGPVALVFLIVQIIINFHIFWKCQAELLKDDWLS